MLGGEVLYFDNERGTGFVTGDDGNRYVFDRSDLPGIAAISKGARIEFQPEGDRARRIATRSATTSTPPMRTPVKEEDRPAAEIAASPQRRSVPSVAVSAPDRAAVTMSRGSDMNHAATPDMSMWSYFRTAVTTRYARFSGRARRKEYWSFALFCLIGYLVAGAAGLAIDGAAGNGDEPVFMILLIVLFGIAMLVPGLAMTVRRQHDIGLSGWFILLGLIPTFGSLIIIVFALIPTQRHENRWGPPPAGS